MSYKSNISRQVADIIITSEAENLEIDLVGAPRPRSLWNNILLNEEMERGTVDASSFAERVGLIIPTHNSSEVSSKVVGICDRYGGGGIGRNGGSGRNVLANGFLIKGIGRTPLVGTSTPLSHASGGAYLEECVREAIFSTVVAHDFPYGAVPVFAIVDTGLIQHWPEDIFPQSEPRTLLIRPNFCRPAHFERALGFDSDRLYEGERDFKRVHTAITLAMESIGRDSFMSLIDDFWVKWAHQLAYGFVHRLSHGNNTTSNISLDGSLVDFGAASTVPSWGNCATSYDFDPFINRLSSLLQGMNSVYYYIERVTQTCRYSRANVDAIAQRCKYSFKRFVTIEILRLCGVPDSAAIGCVRDSSFEVAWHACFEAIDFAQRTQIDMIIPCDFQSYAWPLLQVHSRKPPKQLNKLRNVVYSLLDSSEIEIAVARSTLFSRSRPGLSKSTLRAEFFSAFVENFHDDHGALQGFVDDFISEHTVSNFREKETRINTASVTDAFSAAIS